MNEPQRTLQSYQRRVTSRAWHRPGTEASGGLGFATLHGFSALKGFVRQPTRLPSGVHAKSRGVSLRAADVSKLSFRAAEAGESPVRSTWVKV